MKKYFLISLSVLLLTVLASNEKKGTINPIGYLSEYDPSTNISYTLKIPKQSIFNYLPYELKHNYYKDSLYRVYDYTYSPLYKDYDNIESIGYYKDSLRNGRYNLTKGNEILLGYIKEYYYNNIAPKNDTNNFKVLDTLFLYKSFDVFKNTLPSNNLVTMDFGDISEPSYHNFLFYAYNYFSTYTYDTIKRVYLKNKMHYYLAHIDKPDNRLFAYVYNSFDGNHNIDEIFFKSDSIFNENNKLYDNKTWINYYYFKGLVYFYNGNSLTAQYCYLLALNNIENTTNTLSNADKLLLKSRITYSLYDIYNTYSGFNESYYDKSKEISTLINMYSREHSIQLTNIGLIQESELLLNRVLYVANDEQSFLENNCILLKNIKYVNPVFLSKIYNNIGTYFFQKNETKWALFYHLEALAKYLENNTNVQSQDYTFLLLNLANDYGQLKDFTNSNKYNKMLIEISYYTNSPGYFQYQADNNYINDLLKYGDTSKAILEIENKITQLNNSLSNNTIHPFNYQESFRTYNRLLETIYANRKQYDSAYKYLLSSNSYTDLTKEYSSLVKGEVDFYRERDNFYSNQTINQKTHDLDIKQKESEILKLKEEKSTAEKNKLESENKLKNTYIDSLEYKDSINKQLIDSISNLNSLFDKVNKELDKANKELNKKVRKLNIYITISLLLTAILVIAARNLIRNITNQNYMSTRESLIKQEQLVNKLQKNQTELYRSNLNPHFLKNLLQDLSYAINTENNKILLTDFTDDIMKLVNDVWLISKDFDISISKEFEIIESYLYLATKYKTTAIKWELITNDIDTGSIRIPSLITLNLIENSIKHAFPDTIPKERRMIKIESIFINNRVEIHISDTGQGFDLNRIGNGIKIVKERLEYYNEFMRLKNVTYNDILIDITSEKQKGTKIIIKI